MFEIAIFVGAALRVVLRKRGDHIGPPYRMVGCGDPALRFEDY
jgi:hypothetical protein